MLPEGQVVAIKRAQQGSMHSALEFKTEIELLSRVHHKNLVGLLGFCFEQGEQMLVYEFMANGTLRESLSGISTLIQLCPQIENTALHFHYFGSSYTILLCNIEKKRDGGFISRNAPLIITYILN